MARQKAIIYEALEEAQLVPSRIEYSSRRWDVQAWDFTHDPPKYHSFPRVRTDQEMVEQIKAYRVNTPEGGHVGHLNQAVQRLSQNGTAQLNATAQGTLNMALSERDRLLAERDRLKADLVTLDEENKSLSRMLTEHGDADASVSEIVAMQSRIRVLEDELQGKLQLINQLGVEDASQARPASSIIAEQGEKIAELENLARKRKDIIESTDLWTNEAKQLNDGLKARVAELEMVADPGVKEHIEELTTQLAVTQTEVATLNERIKGGFVEEGSSADYDFGWQEGYQAAMAAAASGQLEALPPEAYPKTGDAVEEAKVMAFKDGYKQGRDEAEARHQAALDAIGKELHLKGAMALGANKARGEESRIVMNRLASMMQQLAKNVGDKLTAELASGVSSQMSAAQSELDAANRASAEPEVIQKMQPTIQAWVGSIMDAGLQARKAAADPDRQAAD